MAKDTGRIGEFAIERSIRIAASDTTVFELINDLRKWEHWNPNGRGDTAMERTYSGEARGIGAIATWRSRRSGAGKMQITSATPCSEIIVAIDFERPVKVRNVNTFQLTRAGSETILTWSMRGPKPPLAKLLGLIFNVDKAMVKHFDDGLSKLESIAEANQAPITTSNT
jgi:hypothetical protein